MSNQDIEKEFYQNQAWYVKLWRNRHRIGVPYWAVSTWIWNYLSGCRWPVEFKFHWNLAMGTSDYKMKNLVVLSEPNGTKE